MNPSRTLKLIGLLTAALAVSIRAQCALFDEAQEKLARRAKTLAPRWHIALVWFPDNGAPGEGWQR